MLWDFLLLFVLNLNLNFVVVRWSWNVCQTGPWPWAGCYNDGKMKEQAHSQAALLGGASLWNGEIMETRCAVDAWEAPRSVWELLSVRGWAHYSSWKLVWPPLCFSSLYCAHTWCKYRKTHTIKLETNVFWWNFFVLVKLTASLIPKTWKLA